MNPEEYMEDVEAVNYWKKMQTMYPNDAKMRELAWNVVHTKSRDHARTPIPWTSEAPNAGFTAKDVKPWMKLMPDYATVNAEAQRGDDNSEHLTVFQFWKRGLANRQEHKGAFVYGEFEFLGDADDADDPIFAYTKTGNGEKWAVVLNFSPDETTWTVPGDLKVDLWVAGNYVKGKPNKMISGSISLRPWEGVLGLCI
jgi:glycosidase